MRIRIFCSLLIAAAASVHAGVPTNHDQVRDHYFAAQEALSAERYEEAAEAFERAYRQAQDAASAAEALYWSAFAGYREGGMSNLHHASEKLLLIMELFADSSNMADVQQLAARVEAERARRGDAVAAMHVAARAVHLEQAAQAAAMARAEQSRSALSSAEAALRFPTQRNDRDDLRIAALNALVHLDAERALPMLRSILEGERQGDTAHLKAEAIFLLPMLEIPAAESLLIELAVNEPDPRIRARAIYCLAAVENADVVPLLEKVLEGDAPEEVQEQAVLALTLRGGSGAVGAVRKLAAREDAAPRARGIAIEYLGAQGTPEDADFLMDLFDTLSDLELKDRALGSIGRSSCEKARKWMLARARDENLAPRIREKAFYWAGHDREVTTRQLVDIYREMKGSEFRLQALHVIGRRGDREAVDLLIQVIGSEGDGALRRAAIFLLAMAEDKRAADVLEEVIRQ